MMPISEDYLLLLHTLFFDHPLRMVETAKLFQTEGALKEGFEVYLRVTQTSAKRQDTLRTRLKTFDAEAIRKKLADQGIGCLFYHSPAYPDYLKQIFDPPLVLYYKGDINVLYKPMLGVVGSRSASDYGEKVTASLVKGLLPYVLIVSGMAQGIDTVAHHAALHNGYPTVAVMGTGLDNPYPDSNKKLFQAIIDNGLVLTEYPLGTPAMPFHFPQRNRIISGLSKGVLVVEAGEKSGAMITARMALEQNREVFAVPGSIFSETSKGTHVLIQDGAKLVQSAQDILEELQQTEKPALFDMEEAPVVVPKPTMPLHLSEDEQKIWDCLGPVPVRLEEVLERSQLPVHVVLPCLTLFEIKDMIEQLPGKMYRQLG